MKIKSAKMTYYILFGEGERGRWRVVVATPIGIKRILTRYRCDGWARAYEKLSTAGPTSQARQVWFGCGRTDLLTNIEDGDDVVLAADIEYSKSRLRIKW